MSADARTCPLYGVLLLSQLMTKNHVVVEKPITQSLVRSDLLGFFTHPGTADDYLALVKTSIEDRAASTVYYHNLHTLYVYVNSDEYRQTFDNKTVIVDGMGVLFLYKLARFPLSRDYRVTYVDFIMPLMRLARDKGWRVFHIGQEASVQEKAFAKIRAQVPGIQIAGQHGYFDLTESSDETHQVIKSVNDFSTDLLLVGLGTPQQEFWVDTNRDALEAPVVMTCGSCMEYVAGFVNTAPRWMGRAGLEWLFRLSDDPRRFAFRYLIQPFLLGFILLRNNLQKRNKRHQN